MTVGLLSFVSQGQLDEGLVASRARVLTQNSAPGNTQTQARSAHIATEHLTAIKIGFAGFVCQSNTGGLPPDTGLGAPTTVTSGVEYNGAFAPVTFAGSLTGTIPDLGLLFSDWTAVDIPAASVFWVPNFRTNPNGVYFNAWQNSFLGEAIEVAASGLTDKTAGGTIGNTIGWSCPPLAIIGLTKNASVIIIGDSGPAGTGDTEDSSNTASGFNGKIGTVAHSLGNVPFLNIARGFATAQNWLSDAAPSNLIIQKSSHIISQIGANDLLGRTPAQVIADTQTMAALKRANQKFYVTTINPRSTSSDNLWATLLSQTAVSQASQNTINDAYRAGVAGFTGCFDIASALESSRNSDLWIPATPGNTLDGLHCTPQGQQLIVNSGVVGPIAGP